MDNKTVERILVQGYEGLLRLNEGVLIIDEETNKYYGIVKVKDENDNEIVAIKEDIVIESLDPNKTIKTGVLFWLHKTKEDCVDAYIDDYKIKQEIDILTTSGDSK